MGQMLQDRVAIITGSGRGIGRATALAFAAEGAKVVVCDIDAEPAEETVAEIEKAGGKAIAYPGDVAAAGYAPGVVQAAAEAFGGLHIIVNNAGYTWDALIHKMTEEQWDKILDLHLKAPWRIIQAAKPLFCDAAKKGITVDTGSERVAVGVPSKIRAGFIGAIPMGRAGTPEEAAGAILFFASPLSDYVSGQLLVCGGGFSM
jgi:NAD(P)-dependent dehydrogenase (short-subunit alcohol dehydrogenase family)